MEAKKAVLNQIKCDNCGAPLKLEQGEQIVNCPFCHSTQHFNIELKEVKAEPVVSHHAEQSFQQAPHNPSKLVPVSRKAFETVLKILFIIIFLFVLYTIIRRWISFPKVDPLLLDYLGS